jgi:putative transposase
VPRPLRQELPGGLFHVFARGNNGRPIYLDDRDRARYFELLQKAVTLRSWHCLSYCLMDNHMHLLLEKLRPNLAPGIQQLHGQYARKFNDRYSCTGHLFDGRYHAVLIKSDRQLLAVLRYIALNPVKAGLCRRPHDYSWSSHAATLGGTAPPFLARDRLFWHLGGLVADPRDHYADLVEHAPDYDFAVTKGSDPCGQPWAPVAVCGAPTGFDSGEPRWRR